MKIISPQLEFSVRGFGRAWPKGDPVTNADILARHPDLKSQSPGVLMAMDRRIDSDYGFSTRYLSHWPGEEFQPGADTSESLASRAVHLAVEGHDPHQIQAFILGTTTTRRYTGSQASSVLGEFGVKAPAYEIKAGCSTSLATLHMAQSLLNFGYDNVLVACAETLSKVAHPGIRENWFGLADGGAALWLDSKPVANAPRFRVLKSFFSTDGQLVDLYTTQGDLPPSKQLVETGKYYLNGDLANLGANAKVRYLEMIDGLLPTETDRKSIQWIVPHQVSRAIIDEMIQATGLSGQVVWNAREFGNIGGASIVFSLAYAIEQKYFKKGDRVLFISVGGGLSFASQLWEII